MTGTGRRAARLALARIAVATAALLAYLPDRALAAAGGGSSGFGGGGGGGGGSFGGGGSSGSGDGGGLVGFLVVAVIVIGIFVAGAIASWLEERRLRRREERVATASAEAAEDDPHFAADAVRQTAGQLFRDVHAAWTARDRARLGQLVGPDLLAEWTRRLDDFDAKGWHNVVEVKGDPEVRYVGLANREDDTDDRVVVRVEATLKDVVRTSQGGTILAAGEKDEDRLLEEWWTLGRRDGGWVLLSIEQEEEGEHHLKDEIVTTPWSDVRRLRDEALVEGAVADKVAEGFSVAEVADLDFAGDARAAALDLSLADGRFAPDVLEAAARRAVEGWAEAVDGDDAALLAVADEGAARELLHPGDPTGRTRLVVRGPRIRQVRIAALDAGAQPPRMTIEVDVSGTRYVQDRQTAAVLSGSASAAVEFTERWALTLSGPDSQPWRIAA
ncbi:MAG TPA: TIM44-like domain-containing protein [Thermoleophilaceae bacterium]